MRMRILVSAIIVSATLFGQDGGGEQPHVTFMTKFEEAVKGDNYAQMKDLVLKNQPFIELGFFLYEAEFCSAVSNKSEEDRKYRLNILEKLATLAQQETKNKMLGDRVAWLKTLTPEQCVKKLDLVENESQGEQLYYRAEKSAEKGDFKAAAAKFEKAYPSAVAIGDAFWQVNISFWLASCYKGAAEDFETAYHWKRGLEIARDLKISNNSTIENIGQLKRLATTKKMRDDLIDIGIPVEESKAKYTAAMEKLAAEAANPLAGAGADSKPGAGAPGKGGAMPSALPPMANKHTMRIEWVDVEKGKYKEVVGRPIPTANIGANGPWLNWYFVEIAPGGPSKSDKIPGDNSLKNDKGKLLFDPDGKDGKAAEERVKVQEGKADVVVFKNRGYQDTSLAKVDVHHRLLEDPRSFNVNGIALSFKSGNPADAKMMLRFQGATAVTTKFDGWDITIFDDSANGEFNTWGDDSMVISKGPVTKSIPLSRYLYLGDLLFELKLDANGQNMRFKPYDGPLALVEFKYVATTMPQFMILEGFNENAQVYFNLMECKDKPMWMPPGEYKFRNGYFMFGEGEKRETISVKNTRCTNFSVKEGQLNKLEMGGAKPPGFIYTWKAELEKDKGRTMVKVPGKTIQLFGCGGEEYGLFMTGVFRPQVKMRMGKDGPVFFDKQMRAPAREDLDDAKPWPDVVFFPKEVEAEKSSSGDVYIQLEGDYPKLGKITSTPQQVQ